MLYSPLVFVLFGSVLVKSNDLHVHTESSLALIENSSIVYPKSWISDLFYQALVNFTVRDVGSTACLKQVEMYENNLKNYTNWAVKMSESWDRRPIGILVGNRYHLGIYDECVGVRYPVNGQYCISEVTLRPTVRNNDILNKHDNLDRVYDSHAWKSILEWTFYPDQVQRNILNIGICIPDACTASDLQTSLQNELNKVFLPEKVNAIVEVDQIMCTVKEDMYPYNTSFYITSGIFGLLITICCGITIHHYRQLCCDKTKTSKASDNVYSYVHSFSFINSMKELLKYNENQESNNIYGFKVMIFLLVSCCHRYGYLAGNPMVYAITAEDVYTGGPDIFLTAMNGVDPYFFISGFLLSFYLPFKQSGQIWMKIKYSIVNRIIRLLPAYCAIIAVTAHIIPHLGDGPLWPRKIWEEADNCKNYWWANLLFINNFIDFKYQCLMMSWYVSCDIQFYVIGIIVVCVYMENKKYGIRLLITFLGLSLSVPFIYTIFTKSDGITKLDIPILENPRTSVSLNKIYRSSYMRSIPYFIGLTFGFITAKLKKSDFKLSQKVVHGSTLVIIVISLWIQFYGVKFYWRHRPYYPLENALYSVLSHCTFTMISAWIGVCHFTSGYGVLMKLFSNRICVVLGKLSYSVMLVNLTVIIMSQSSQRVSAHLSVKSTVDAFIYDTVNTYIIGLMLYLIVEAPFENILKKLLEPWKQKILNTNRISTENLNSTKHQKLT